MCLNLLDNSLKLFEFGWKLLNVAHILLRRYWVCSRLAWTCSNLFEISLKLFDFAWTLLEIPSHVLVARLCDKLAYYYLSFLDNWLTLPAIPFEWVVCCSKLAWTSSNALEICWTFILAAGKLLDHPRHVLEIACKMLALARELIATGVWRDILDLLKIAWFC